MDLPLVDQHPLQASCPTGDSPEHKSGVVQQMCEEATSPPHSDVQTGVVDTSLVEEDRVSSEQTKIHIPNEGHAHTSEESSPRPVPSSPEPREDVSSGDDTSSMIPNAQSSHRQKNHTDVSTSMVAANQASSGLSGSTSSNAALQQPKALRLSESLGWEGCAGILGGFLGLLGVFGFYIFLWFGYGPAPEAAKATWVWRQLAIRGWMPQAVTLASIFLRFIIGIQATICTSMIAALLLERLFIPRLQVAQASVMRDINAGPWKLVMLVLSSKRNLFHFLRHLESWLIISLAFLSLTLQFTSTILLSDMRTFLLVGDLNTTTFNGLFAFPGEDQFALNQGSLTSSAPVYPVFRDFPTTHDSRPDTRGFSDTGLTQRGLLPITTRDTRTSVREYDGMGMVMSSRVACMRPVITDASLEFMDAGAEYLEFRNLQGILHYSQSLRDACPGMGPLCSISEQCEQLPFQCTMPTAIADTWVAGACILDGVGGYFRDWYRPMWNPEDGPWSENSSIWLVYSTSMTIDDWISFPHSFSMQSAQVSADNEWTTYEITPGFFIRIAVYFSDFDFSYQDIHMKAPEATKEPEVDESLIVSEHPGIDKVQTYLGLGPLRQSIAERGILSLEMKSSGNTPYTRGPSDDDLLKQPADQISPTAVTASSIRLDTLYELSDAYRENTTFGLCVHCSMDVVHPHRAYKQLFSAIILSDPLTGGRAADALHSFISVTGINVYNQFLATSMNFPQESRVVMTREVTVPGSWPPTAAACAGLITVASLLAAYLSLVTLITILYARNTRYSRYGNVWHTISQLMDSDELEEALKLGNDASDKAVKLGLRTQGPLQGNVLVKLGKTDGCENITFKRFGRYSGDQT